MQVLMLLVEKNMNYVMSIGSITHINADHHVLVNNVVKVNLMIVFPLFFQPYLFIF